MQAREYVRGVIRDAREERREFKENATRLDYVQKNVKLFVAFAILYRVTCAFFAAGLAEHDVTEDDINWSAFGQPIDGLPAHVDLAGRLGQAAVFFIGTYGYLPSLEAGAAVSSLLAVNIGVLVFDPVLFVIDYLE